MITAAAVSICVVLGALALFQGLLVLGAPLGRFAWGGQHRVLPNSLRVSSLVAIAVYALIAWVVLARVAAIPPVVPSGVVRIAVWVVAAYFLLDVGLNLSSKSSSERAVMPAVCAALCALCIVVALS
jgi:hypothetical protein